MYDPTNPADRNGLLVGSSASGGTIPTVTGLLFNDQPQITVSAGTPITTKVSMTGKGNGTLLVEIRKDIALFPDASYTTLSKNVVIYGDTVVTMDSNWIANDQGIGFREYFGKVLWNGAVVYDPTDPTSRENVKIGSGSGGGIGGGGGTNNAVVTYNIIEQKSLYGSGTRINVPQMTQVEVYATVSSSASTTGTIAIEVRRDYVWSSDNSLITLTKQTSLAQGTNTIDMGSFIASDLSGSNNFRQYFFKTALNGIVINDPTDPNTRESVTTYATTTPPITGTPPPTASVQLITIGFDTNNNPQTSISVNKYQNVNVHARISSTGSTSAIVSVEVRKDYVLLPDGSFKTLTNTVNINAGTQWYYIGTFSPDESNSLTLRQYFGRASLNGNLVFDPTDPNTRPRVTVN